MSGNNNKNKNKNKSMHIPVLLDQMLIQLNPQSGGVYVDGTFGRGGYTRAILDIVGTKVIAIDRDPDAITEGRKLEKEFEGRLAVVEGKFSDLKENVEKGFQKLGISDQSQIQGLVLDIGVSSPQLDDKSRGFSFTEDAPLDMRMAKSGPTAADLVNTLPEEELANLLYVYGEERKSRHIAHRIILQRAEKPIETTLELSNLIQSVIKAPRKKAGQKAIHPATRSFQALRIAVNQELDELSAVLEASVPLLETGAALVVVTFHSLEDRIVKNFFREKSGKTEGVSRHDPRIMLNDNQQNPEILKILKRKPVLADEDELALNPRSRSAKLRTAIKCDIGEAA